MKKQVINRFLFLLAHPTSIDQHNISPLQVVQGKNSAKSSRPHKKRHSRRGFSTPNALPREREADRRI
jgi:ABC-type sugar transport system ATPase subunit